MIRALGVTDHAVERYIKRYRPALDKLAARAELEALAAGAAPTKRQTLVGDARMYLGTTPDGEKVPLAVRGDAVVTVLEADSYETQIDMSVSDLDQDLLEDSRATIEACRAMVGAEAPREVPGYERATQRETAARDLLDRWRRGEYFTDKAIDRAHETLGLKRGA